MYIYIYIYIYTYSGKGCSQSKERNLHGAWHKTYTECKHYAESVQVHVVYVLYIHTYVRTYTHLCSTQGVFRLQALCWASSGRCCIVVYVLYIHTYVHTYIHTHTHMHAYIRTFKHAYIHIHAYMHTYMKAVVRRHQSGSRAFTWIYMNLHLHECIYIRVYHKYIQ
jgi:hypothetical protein